MRVLRHFPHLVMLFLFILMLNACRTQTGKDQDKPNILFVAVDDMNDWAGFLAGKTGMKIHTPKIDRLAASAMIFLNAHTPSPACAPRV